MGKVWRERVRGEGFNATWVCGCKERGGAHQ